MCVPPAPSMRLSHVDFSGLSAYIQPLGRSKLSLVSILSILFGVSKALSERERPGPNMVVESNDI